MLLTEFRSHLKSRNKNPTPTSAAFIAVVLCSPSSHGSLLEFLDAIPASSRITFLIHCKVPPHTLPHCALTVRLGMPGLALHPGEVVIVTANPPLSCVNGILTATTSPFPLDSVAAALPHSSAVILLGECEIASVPGIRSFKAAGGLVVSQKPAKSPATDPIVHELLLSLSDTTLPAHEIPAHLEHLTSTRIEPTSAPCPQSAESNQARLRKLTTLVKRHTGLDLASYKPEGVSRRIQRRMGICHLKTLPEYLAHVQKNPEEAAQLASDMLISVTRFFRDPDVFARLRETVLPGILKGAKSHPVRIWIPACATGEEAYTFAILMEEVLQEISPGGHGFKIFATDLDREALAFASRGVFPLSIAEDVPPELLERHFQRSSQSFQVERRVRERIVFAKHNILKDPPFTRLDLVSCRNLLIYLQPDAQSRILSVLHFALRPGGALVLGQSESTGDKHEEFTIVDPKCHIFFKKPNSTPVIHDALQFGSFPPLTSLFEHLSPPQSSPPPAPTILLETFTNRILSHMDRTCFVLNDRHEILFSFGNPGKYTTLSEGRASMRLEDLLPDELSIPFTTALGRVQIGNPVRFGPITLQSKKSRRAVTILVETLHLVKDDRDYVLVFIDEDRKTTSTGKTAFDLHQSTLRIRELEEELEFNKSRLDATCEELEASREELQTSNEELQAANEELQSTNEELESVNEELQTVNSEYQCKIQDLTKSNEELENFISSADIATLFLDPDLRLRRLTPGATQLTGLLPHDLGRPVTDFSHPLLAEAAAATRLILAGRPKVEKSIPHTKSDTLLLRATPFVRKNGCRSGATISYIPIPNT